ncbi:MAG: MFS transporter [Anaerolineales bacterium]|nr:MFS transporter [Anaerolineales bacterium]
MSKLGLLRRRWSRLSINVGQMTAGGKWALALPVNTQKNLRNFFLDGVLASASDTIPITYLTVLLLALGANNLQIGSMTALASLSAILLLIPGASLVDRYPERRRQIVTISGGIFGRLPLLLLALTPVLLQGPQAVYVAIALKILMDAARNLGLPGWVSVTADIVPLSWRGRYFGSRNLAMGIAGMLVTYLVGYMITIQGELSGYAWAFGIAFALGMGSTYFFARLKVPVQLSAQAQTPGRYTPQALWRTLHGNPNFQAFFIYTVLWNFSINLATPFFTVYLVESLGATAAVVGTLAIVSRISALPAQHFFGSLVDRWGAHRLSRLTGLIIPFLPLAWLFVTSPWQIIPIHIVGGMVWAGYGLASFNFLLDVSDPEQRARYSAIFQIAVAIATAAGAWLGGLVGEQWGIPVLFLSSGIGRLIAAGYFQRYVKPPQLVDSRGPQQDTPKA